MSLIKCKNLILGYDGRQVVSNVNFSVNQGDYLCIVGQNGSGKSTLMKTLLGLQRQLDGEIIFGDGFESDQIGYLPQQTAIQKDFPASVWEVVLSGCQSKTKLRPFYSQQEKALASKNIQLMGLNGMENKCYRELSGGQQQRVLLARALCATSKLLLLDEPVAGLDPKVTAEMYSLVEHLNKNCGITVIMVSHDIVSVLKYATHVLHITDSVFWGTKAQYVASNVGKQFVGGAL